LLSVNDNTELILHGGLVDSTTLYDIWKYSSGKNTWSQLGTMLKNRREHSAIAVAGLECP
jgi:hypothetical protein